MRWSPVRAMYYRYKSEDNRFSGTDPEELEDALEEQREVFLKHEVEGRCFKELAIAAQDHEMCIRDRFWKVPTAHRKS